ncbi:MAG: hypothetical protein JWQ35_2260 [Bacteriovoracaceae bacterium]|nr:hypothetical protein [Bacteriovoracaceae bacterium]
MRSLWRSLWVGSALLLLTFGIRIISVEQKKRAALTLVEKKLGLKKNRLDVETYNYLRGDYHVTLSAPPFKEISWTVNLLTNQIISWQSKIKEDSVLRSLL